MAAVNFALALEQGATKRFHVILKTNTNPDPSTSPVWEPTDLTGCTARLQVRQLPGRPVLIELTTDDGDGLSAATGTDGRLDIWFSAAKTELMTIKKGRYDLEITYPSGDVQRVLEGQVTCDLAVTQAA